MVPGVTAVAVTPAGNCSNTLAEVPLAVPPLLPSFSVYVIEPPVNTGPVEDFASVNDTGAFTVVLALAQLELVQLVPGVGGVVALVRPTDA